MKSFRGSMCVLLVALSVSAAAAQEYELVNLGAFQPYAINNSRQIAGANWGQYHPLIWQDGTITDLLQSGWSEASANDINDAGAVVGQQVDWSNARQFVRPYMLSNGAVTFLDNGIDIGGARAISNNGYVAGTVQQKLATGWSPSLPFLWSNGAMTVLPTLAGSTHSAVDVNDSGVVVGRSQSSATSWEAVYWRGGAITVLARLGTSAAVEAVNDAGVMVGWTTTYAAPIQRAVMWREGLLSELGTLGGAMSAAYDINENDEIVGNSQTATGRSAAFVHTGGQMINLDEIVGAPNGWWLVRAVRINDHGDIIGVGRLLSDSPTAPMRGFLLKALPSTPEKQLERLLSRVEVIVTDPGVSRSLAGKLQNALASLERENAQSACNQVAAFENEVRAQSGKKISTTVSEELLAAAQRLAVSLGC